MLWHQSCAWSAVQADMAIGAQAHIVVSSVIGVALLSRNGYLLSFSAIKTACRPLHIPYGLLFQLFSVALR